MRLLGLVLVLLTIPGPASAQQPNCQQSEADRLWVISLWDAWNKVRPAPHPAPLLVTYDTACVWEIDSDMTAGRAHGGMVPLPDGEMMPPVVASFASAFGPDNRPFLVMASPVIWRSQPNLQNDPNLDRLIRAVFVHEMTHVLQTPALGPRIGELSKRLPDPDALTDDIVQDTFGDDPAFRQAYEVERDLLYEAAREQDSERRARLVRAAVSAMQARRARFFTGERAFFSDLEDLFLVMEGAGQWSGYQLLRREGVGDADAVAQMRRGGRRWSQDQGLAIFLLLDVMGKDWKPRVFNAAAPSVSDLLLR
jgi:hypothetical protein